MNYANFWHCLSTLCLLMVCSINILQAAQLTPADHLVPPPLPAHYQALKHEQQLPHNTDQGFMTRIARWFGFGNNAAPPQQQLSQETQKSYNYVAPQNYFDKDKPCNLCNKYPWVPIFPTVQQNQWAHSTQNLEAQASQNYGQRRPNPANVSIQQVPARQRAVQWHFPLPHNSLYWNSFKNNVQLPTPPPVQSAAPAQRPTTQNTHWIQTAPKAATEYAQYEESIGAQSNLAPHQVYPTQLPPTTEATFEIVQSHQVTDFVSSIEYPATYVKASTIDLLLEQTITTTEPPTNTVKYKHPTLAPNLDAHIPGSQILTNPSSFTDINKLQKAEETTLQYRYFDEVATSTYAPPNYVAQSLEMSNFHQPPALYENHKQQINEASVVDNFVSASSHNLTQYDNKEEQWTPFFSNSYDTTTLEATTNRMDSDKDNEWYKILEKHERVRDTPKRLLDSPIQYQKNGEKTATRDPSSLNYRLGAVINKKPQEFHYSNHAYPEVDNTTAESAIYVTPQVTTTTTTERMTATSAYGAIDASGQFAGISPPAPPPPPVPAAVPASTIQKVVIPFTTKNQPRPFEPSNLDSVSSSTTVQHWLQPEESKLVKSATAIPPAKYLTKILATNLRELLNREKENNKKSHGVDLRKLQRNIDEWTQLEYTALGHKSSTPTIRGRSKHIPVEYLTTTTMAPPRQPKTTKLFKDLSTSINNLEPILEPQGGKRFDYVPIDDNRLLDLEEPSIINHSFATTTTSKPTTAPMSVKYLTTQATHKVIASAAPKIHLNENETKEMWQKTRVFISPQTNEKVYVVTPVPRFFPQRRYLTTPDPPTKSIGHKPRFAERRSTENPQTMVSSSAKEYNAQLFGLMGLSAYVPARPVEIIDGNSKVVTIVTSAPEEESGKSTMKPSPR